MSQHRIRVHEVRFDGDVAIIIGIDLASGARVSFHAAPGSGQDIAQAVAAATDEDTLPVAEVDGTDLAGWPDKASEELDLTEHAEARHHTSDPIEVIDIGRVPRQQG